MIKRCSCVLLVLLVAVAAACTTDSQPAPEVLGGDPELGRQLLVEYGCGSCHTIRGVRGANAVVGPSLANFGRQQYIAGRLSNTAANLITWIQNPQAISPGNAMPDLGVTETEARHMAAYLYRE
ncbi:MAG: cytochrome C [Anaerolineaceae bacterium]|nr:cytochrome C [Anaerolineaceae bacterium]